MKMPPGLRVVTTGAADGIRRRLLVPPDAAPTAPAADPAPSAAPARRSSSARLPGFSTGLRLALGALTGWFLFRQLLRLEEFLTLLLLSAFLAVSLEPVVAALCRRRLRRGWAVAAVLGAFLLLAAGFLLLVVPPVGQEAGVLARRIPLWLDQVHDHHSALGRIEDRFHLAEQAKSALGGSAGPGLMGGVLGAGRLLLDTVTSVTVVATVTLYLMAGMPDIKEFCYRFVKGSRRGRARELTEEILARTGRYMLGNLVTSAIAGLATAVWCAAVGVPYAAALGVFVALMDLVPIVGSTIGGVVVSLVALAVSWPVALATAGFYVGFRLLEDYLIMPRTMKFAVDVHPFVTIVAVLVGGALLGIVGALVAVPAAVALGLLLDEFVFPHLDRR
ncbi:AI-2E family transporter [Kitasatospora cineracea]|uniref:PurR-regulated permease PerM n=1 Tax=Kitasatospora cineracea TaxID=88074 RepID=A0A3N4RSL0_9ACTN|nr:AI-2E family transporter [Kitasatospora cineracea]RPE36378.1 putative PurR-regulated permease PerM [Kitasatospora cineracea]